MLLLLIIIIATISAVCVPDTVLNPQSHPWVNPAWEPRLREAVWPVEGKARTEPKSAGSKAKAPGSCCSASPSHLGRGLGSEGKPCGPQISPPNITPVASRQPRENTDQFA